MLNIIPTFFKQASQKRGQTLKSFERVQPNSCGCDALLLLPNLLTSS